jgi:hypothetical protein
MEDTCLERTMPLKRGRILGYDADQMAFKFTMMHEAWIVDCEISGAAMDDLAGDKGTRPRERPEQFERLRDVVERVASDVFDASGMMPGEVVRIFSKHVRKR